MQETRYREDEIEIDLWELFVFLIRWLWLLTACAVIGGMMGFLVCRIMYIPRYESTTKIYILDKDSQGGNLTYSDMQLSSMLIKDYVQLIKDRTVLEEVLCKMGSDETYESLRERVKVEAQSDTRIIVITVTDLDPKQAQIYADEVRRIAAVHIRDVTQIQAVNVVEEANLPESPNALKKGKWTAVGGLLGLAACAAGLVLYFLLDDTIKSSENIENYLGLYTLSMIPLIEESDGRKKKFWKKFFSEMNLKRITKNGSAIHYRDSDEIHNPKPSLDETGDLEEVL